MRSTARHLRLAPSPPDRPLAAVPPSPSAPRADEGEDLVVLAVVLAVSLLPLVGQALGGHWGAGTLGFATLGALASGAGLAALLRRNLRA